MFLSIRHVTRFRYSAPISESIVEARMQPVSDTRQRCLSFSLTVSPRARLSNYRDHFGNTVTYFDIARHHSQLLLTAQSVSETRSEDRLPDSFPLSSWDEIDEQVATTDLFEYLMPTELTRETQLLHELAMELRITRDRDPLTLIQDINQEIYNRFEYQPLSTHVDSPIDDALRMGKGVCQDFAHIMLALCRLVRLPARYVSGYLFHRTEDHDRSAEDASHAWVEVLMPQVGWVGFDPTNNIVCGERHVRAATGGDYRDVPPTKGVFKGQATSELKVAVDVQQCERPDIELEYDLSEEWTIENPPDHISLTPAVGAEQQQAQAQQ